MLVDLDIAWFGERWFFDNFDLGFELVDNSRFTTNVVARVNSDRAFFGKTNTRYINFTLPRAAARCPCSRSRDPAGRRIGREPVQAQAPRPRLRGRSSGSKC